MSLALVSGALAQSNAGCSTAPNDTEVLGRGAWRVEAAKGGVVSSEPAYRVLSPVTRRPIPPDILAELTAAKPKGPPLSVAPYDPTAASLAEASTMKPGSRVRAVVSLDELHFDFESMQDVSDDERASRIAARREQLEPSQTLIATQLGARGGTEIERSWLTNSIGLTVDADRLGEIAKLPGVRGVDIARPLTFGAAYDGVDFRNGTRTASFVYAGLTGASGGRAASNTPVRIAIIDGGFPVRDHVAFKTDGSQFALSRISKVYDCRTGSCSITSANGTPNNHGHGVAAAAVSSIENGQDGSWSGSYTTEQTRRSGMAPLARLYYFEVDSSDDFGSAIDQAVSDGADIISFSLSTGGPTSDCNAGFDLSNLNLKLRNALANGALPIGCGGNQGSASCRVWYPALRPEPLAIVALNSGDNSVGYDSLQLEPTASLGGMQIKRWDGVTNTSYTTAAIDLATASLVTLLPDSSPASYSGDKGGGCSFATPRAAGAAALMKHAFKSAGLSTDPRVISLAMQISGDAWDGNNPGAKTGWGMSDRTGFGRIHAHWPSSTNLTGPWGWGYREVQVNNGEEVCWTVGDANAEPSTVTHWKWAGSYYENDLNATADIDVRVYNACAGQPRQLIGSDAGYDLRTKVQLRGTEVQGKCLQMCTYGYSMPSGGRTFWSMDYFHGGNANDH